MSAHAAEREQESASGATIAFETATRAQALSLRQALAPFAVTPVRANGGWLVELALAGPARSALVRSVRAVSGWLEAERLASVTVRIGGQRYTLLQPSTASATHSVASLLEQVAQLETALASRVVLEQAKGILSAALAVELQVAFDLLRRAARASGRQLHELAADVVSQTTPPHEVARAAGRPGRRRPGPAHDR